MEEINTIEMLVQVGIIMLILGIALRVIWAVRPTADERLASTYRIGSVDICVTEGCGREATVLAVQGEDIVVFCVPCATER